MESKGKLYRPLFRSQASYDSSHMQSDKNVSTFVLFKQQCICVLHIPHIFKPKIFFLKNNKTNKNKKGSITYNAHRREL